MSNFYDFFRKKKLDKFFGQFKFSDVLCALQSVAKFLVFLATIALFLYALIFPHFWIILILLLLFLASLALCRD